MNDDKTHFGFSEVPVAEKASRVRGVFDSVAGRYDLMNDAMSLGLHRVWKRFAVSRAALRPGDRVLDLAAGTGDLSRLMAPRLGPRGALVMSDINERMLRIGRDRLIDAGLAEVRCVLADAECLPFASAAFDRVTMAFGLRNVTRKERALAEIHRVLRPGGRALILEFSHLAVPALEPLYDAYSFRVLPWLGERLAGDAESYRYLAESIRRHPDQATMVDMLREAGFERVRYHNLSGGIVALHEGMHL